MGPWTNGLRSICPNPAGTASRGAPPAIQAVLCLAHNGAKRWTAKPGAESCIRHGGLPQAPGGAAFHLPLKPSPPRIIPENTQIS